MAQNSERTIKEMTSLDLNQQPLCIEYPTLDVDFELKTGLIRLLPTFRGLAGEDPHKHLKEFHVVCSGMRPQGVTEEQVKLQAFPFSLGEKAKDWLYSYLRDPLLVGTSSKSNSLKTTSRLTNHNYPEGNKWDTSIFRIPALAFKTWRTKFVQASTFGVSNEPISLLRQSFGISRAKQGRNSKILQKKLKISIKLVRSIPRCFVSKPPFPERFAKSKKEEGEKEILETLRKVEVNIPLLDAIKQVPRYAKFFKEMCINKSKLRGNERVNMGENVSTILQSKLPPKGKDPGTFSIPCKIGNIGIENAMCDLGASINVMSLAIYESLNIGPLKKRGLCFNLLIVP
ncbi:UNVERIFIED_CONTAM: hypothetical protein Sradi_4431500 [Sesamum radiatum]|uniref:Retrotransposon gag domain-containing protein n=1 Tax=Sesamum radiatum TaxID=300843 RepID=A0AAW2NSP4_SESRA